MNLSDPDASPFVLRRARGDAPTEGPPPAPVAFAEPPPVEDPPCPQCGGKLIDPSGLGWCRRCGYCRSLEGERALRPEPGPTAPAKASPFGLIEFARLLGKTPRWAGTLLLGTVAVVVCTLPPALALPDGSAARCWWTTCQVGLGLLMVLTGQAWAVMVLADRDDHLSAKDALISGRLWALAVRYLPETRRQLWLAAWGLTAILAAVFFVGGLDHWFTYLPRGAASL